MLRNSFICVLLTALLAACGGGGMGDGGVGDGIGDGIGDGTVAPSGLMYTPASVVYTVGQAIAPNTPTSSGSPITHYRVAPALPAGLVLDPESGVISGAPMSVSEAAIYTVTGSNAAGSAAARLSIEVKDHVVPPESLSYLHADVDYKVDATIKPNLPLATGGAITRYSVAPALPEGLVLSNQTGVINGTPTTVQAAQSYVITGSNSAGSVQATIQVAVSAVQVPAMELSYASPRAAYNVGQSIRENIPSSEGGEITFYSISPELPEGLSINAMSGVISGQPTTWKRSRPYVVTGSNRISSTQTKIQLEVVPEDLTWKPAASMNVARSLHTLTQTTFASANPMMVAGGMITGGLIATNTTEYLEGGAWRLGPNLNVARADHTATVLQDGRTTLVVGGRSGVWDELASVEALDERAGHAWQLKAELHEARLLHTATLLPDGRVLVAGGVGSSGQLSSAELYDPLSDTWTLAAPMRTARSYHTASLMPNGQVLVIGGSVGGGAPATDTAEIYDPGTNTWRDAASMRVGRTSHTATVLSDGTQVMVAGGIDSSLTNTVEIYDFTTDRWTAVADMEERRFYHVAALLPNGKVLVAGGSDGLRAMSSSEIYDPVSDVWQPFGDLGTARIFARAARDSITGTWYVVGGIAADATSTTERFTLL